MRWWAAVRNRLIARVQYPELRGIELDSPELTIRRRELVLRNKSARFSFEQWYREIATIVDSAPPGLRVELGSGGGFLEQFVPGLVKTDCIDLPFIDRVCRAEYLPFQNSSVGALITVNVLHHVSDPEAFLSEATRVLCHSGVIVMIEPHVTPFSRLVYRYLHHEPFDPKAPEWTLPPSGRLSGGNEALPWIIFSRDRRRFDTRFPELTIEAMRPHSAFSHILTGGVTTRALLPLRVVRWLRRMEEALPFLTKHAALFCTLTVRRS